MNFKNLLCFGLVIIFINANAQSRKFLRHDTLAHKTHGLVGYPMLTFQPETHLAFGISLIYYFRMQKQDSAFRPSVLHPFAAVTLNKQEYIECPFQLFFKQEKFYLYGIAAFFQYPYKFYGIGNQVPNLPDDKVERFDANLFQFNLSALRKVNSKIYMGLRLQTNYANIIYIEKNRLLDTASIVGKSGNNTMGMGPMFLYDTRDNIFATQKGSFIELASVFNFKGFGSDYSFHTYYLDARTFIPLHKTHILALQGYINVNAGNVPFMQMAMLGGPKRMRGYYEGRYRDNNMVCVQAEYRGALYKDRIGLAVFAGLGAVNHELTKLTPSYLYPTYGAGFRFRFNRNERLEIRGDLAFGQHTHGLYFTLNEAF